MDKILIREEIAWIKLDSTDLYYRSDYIEVMEFNNDSIKTKKVNRINSKSEQFNMKIPVEISDSTDGPGVGGG